MTNSNSIPGASGTNVPDLVDENTQVFHPNIIADIGDYVGVFCAHTRADPPKWYYAEIRGVSFVRTAEGGWLEKYKVRIDFGPYYAETRTVTRDRVTICRHLFNKK